MKFCKDCAYYKIEIKSESYPALKAVIETEYQNCTKIESVDLVSGKKSQTYHVAIVGNIKICVEKRQFTGCKELQIDHYRANS